jgi:hypothetical protein
MHSSLEFYLFLSPESVFHGWPSTSPSFPPPSPDRSLSQQFSNSIGKYIPLSSGENYRNASSSFFSTPSYHTRCCLNNHFYCIILTFFLYEIRQGFFINIQDVSVYEGFGSCLPRSWAKGVSFFTCFLVLRTFFMA